MTSLAYALARAELIRALTAYTGITTADGAPDGTTLIDSNLNGKNDFITEKTILIMTGDAQYEDRGALSFDNTPPATITVANAFKDSAGAAAQITKGTIYRILNISTVEIDVVNINAKIGTNTDAAGTTTLFAWMARLFAIGGQGLVYYGKVTQVDDVTHFRVAGLTGFGDAYFKNYRTYVVRDAAGLGAAPQGEMQPCSAYDSTDGIFTHTDFSVSLAVDDEVLLIHERVAEIAAIKTQTDKLAGGTPGVGSTTENWNAAEADIVSIGANDTKNKLHSLLVNISALTSTATISIRMYMQVNGVERKIYDQDFVKDTDPDGLWIVNGTVGIHEVLRVTAQSDNAGDDGKAIGYDYMLEVM